MLGALACAAALAPLVRGADPAELEVRPLGQRLAALAGGSLGATILLWIAGAFGVELNGLFGLLVGGYLVVWFGAAGLLSLLLMCPSLLLCRSLMCVCSWVSVNLARLSVAVPPRTRLAYIPPSPGDPSPVDRGFLRRRREQLPS